MDRTSTRQIGIARQIKDLFAKTEGVVDVDWYLEEDQEKITFAVDKEKAALNGISTDTVSQDVRIALNGMSAGLMHLEREREPVELLLRLPVRKNGRVSVRCKRSASPAAAGQT